MNPLSRWANRFADLFCGIHSDLHAAHPAAQPAAPVQAEPAQPPISYGLPLEVKPSLITLAPPVEPLSCFVQGLVRSFEEERGAWSWKDSNYHTHSITRWWIHHPTELVLTIDTHEPREGRDTDVSIARHTLNLTEQDAIMAAIRGWCAHRTALYMAEEQRKADARATHFVKLGCPS